MLLITIFERLRLNSWIWGEGRHDLRRSSKKHFSRTGFAQA